MKRLGVALFVLGAAPLAHAQEAAAAESKGEYVARAGDCVACHSVPGGKAFAGGLKMGTPLGAIYSTNITPDPDVGIGNYTFEDFDRAVRKGVAKDGHRLYPAMPYPSYAKITDDDMHALYDFFIKEVPPVKQANKPSEIPGYLSFRWPLAIWDAVFTESGAYVPSKEHDAAWNRGAYLVEGLGHCGACHTPRGWAFQEKALDDGSSKAQSSTRGLRPTCAAISAPVLALGRKAISRPSSGPATTAEPLPSVRCSTSSTTARPI